MGQVRRNCILRYRNWINIIVKVSSFYLFFLLEIVESDAIDAILLFYDLW